MQPETRSISLVQMLQAGLEHHKAGRLSEAEALFRTVAAADPSNVYAFHFLGVIAFQTGKHEKAVELLDAALAINPDYAEALGDRGLALQNLERNDEALASYDKALAIMPQLVETWTNRGALLHQLGRYEEALASHDRVLAARPHSALAHCNRGTALQCLNRYGEALASFDAALAIKPDFADALFNRGVTLESIDHCHGALESYEKAISVKPDFASAHCNRGNLLKELGRVKEAIAEYQIALECAPDFHQVHSNVIFALDLVEGCDAAEQQEERKRWYALHGMKHAPSIRPHGNAADPGRPLRIGYVSADFRKHAAGYAVAPIIRRHDRNAFEVVCYSGVTVEDELTEEIRRAASAWRSTLRMSDDALADLIRADRIDILVDLSSHMVGNRLPVFARKPAPVQVTAWGYPNGTGMPTIDYLLSDPVVVPVKERSLFVEEVIDLPCFVCYEPPGYLPEVARLPALSGRPFTFGCISRVEKISDKALRLWARILAEAPGTQLLVKSTALEDPVHRNFFLDRLSAAGIGAERARLIGRTSHLEVMQTFNEIDLALDPFPHGGVIGTFEALWMGVPVVTIPGASVLGRATASILSVIGMHEWIASDEEGYARTALRVSRDLEALARTRDQMRSRLGASVFGNLDRYVREVESAYRNIWRRWCERH